MLHLGRFRGVTLRNSIHQVILGIGFRLSPIFPKRFLNLGGRGGLLKNLIHQVINKKQIQIYNIYKQEAIAKKYFINIWIYLILQLTRIYSTIEI